MTAFLSGLSPLIFPAWLDLPEAEPPPAKLAGSLRRTSPSTTAKWQSERGGSCSEKKENKDDFWRLASQSLTLL